MRHAFNHESAKINPAEVSILNSKLEVVFNEIGCIDSPISKESRKKFEQKVKELHDLEDKILSTCPKGPDGTQSPEEKLLEIFFNIKIPDPLACLTFHRMTRK